ncbi:NAD(P)-dependent oxidoreductase [Carboxylicivirga sp. M1479]|uniref:NAD(P)-dependent oxidoreductase n=1 Tax=Carboxylicivirga sp. M1479 TaxID=2594476 RepID=UPI001177E76B|nr:NAD(P)-dependent oxidoreductase [Carboxylicivirga sp. M1479]TRX70590.1 dihydrofolate reductase [Carboxylicivirga sp. M1479]
MKFEQIVILDDTGLQNFALEHLQTLSNQTIRSYNNVPLNDEEIIKRIFNADCVFVSWNTPINSSVISQCTKLKYIGMCCSLIDEESANVDVRYAKEQGIIVKGVRDYGDEGVAEFIVSELIQLLKGLGKHQWKNEPIELSKRKVGIIGMGATGLMTAQRIQAFGADVFYYSRTLKAEAKANNIQYLPLDQLLENCEIISFHLPRNTKVLQHHHFELLNNDAIIINTSLGLPFDIEPFEKWLKKEGNFSIFDICGFGQYQQELMKHNKLIYTNATSGWTKEAKERLSQKVMDNVQAYFGELECMAHRNMN